MNISKLIISLLLVFTLASCAGMKVEQNKQAADIHYKMGEIHLTNKNYSEALKELTTAIEKNPGEASYYNAIAIAYGARRMHDKAEKNFKKAIELDNDFSDAYLNLGALYIELKRYDESIETTMMVLRNDFYKSPELAHNNIGWAFLKKGDLRGALENFKKAADLNTRYVMPFYNMGIVYERLDRLEEAARSYEAATKRAPKFAAPYMDLGRLLVMKGDKSGAIKLFEKVIELEPGSSMAKQANAEIEFLK